MMDGGTRSSSRTPTAPLGDEGRPSSSACRGRRAAARDGRHHAARPSPHANRPRAGRKVHAGRKDASSASRPISNQVNNVLLPTSSRRARTGGDHDTGEMEAARSLPPTWNRPIERGGHRGLRRRHAQIRRDYLIQALRSAPEMRIAPAVGQAAAVGGAARRDGPGRLTGKRTFRKRRGPTEITSTWKGGEESGRLREGEEEGPCALSRSWSTRTWPGLTRSAAPRREAAGRKFGRAAPGATTTWLTPGTPRYRHTGRCTTVTSRKGRNASWRRSRCGVACVIGPCAQERRGRRHVGGPGARPRCTCST